MKKPPSPEDRKAATRERKRAWEKKNKERIRQKRKNRTDAQKALARVRARQWQQAHKEWGREKQKAWRKANPDKVKSIRLRHDFGISIEEYKELLDAQDGRCAICGDEPGHTCNRSVRWLCVDHDHRTGAIRGLLCDDCNLSLGRMKDDPDRLLLAAIYLERGGSNGPLL